MLSAVDLTSSSLYHRIRIVSSFDELVKTPFTDGVNALCWQRQLPGDFAEVVAHIGAMQDIVTLDAEALSDLRSALSPAGCVAVEAMLSDYRALADGGLDPCLDCIPAYLRDEVADVLRTDVYSFHVDRAPIMTDTYLCTYIGACSEGLPNEQATKYVDIEDTRLALLAQYQREGGDDFDSYLRDNSYDLHYRPHADAQPYGFGIGNLWRIAIDYPGCLVPPCIHRAPEQKAGDPARLLLIS